MTIEEIKNEIEAINNYLKKYTQIDFEVLELHDATIAVTVQSSLPKNDCTIKVLFGGTFHFSGSLKFTYDVTKPFIELMEDDEKIEAIQKFHLEIGYYPFKLNVKQLENSPVLIASRNLKHEIINEKPNFTESV